MYSIIIFSLITFITASSSLDYTREFSKFMSKYNKYYSTPEEYNSRYAIFSNNYEMIMNHNEQNMDWELDVNVWTDHTWDEFKNTRTGFVSNPTSSRFNFNHQIYSDLPESIDWRSEGIITPVKNQGQCGSCWSFSAVESIESLIALKTNKLDVLSEQELVDCDKVDEGCSGGLMDNAFNYVIKNGLCLEKSYPYRGVNGECKKCEKVVKITGYKDVPVNNQLALKAAVALQPIAVAIEADKMGFQFYKSGVFSGKCGTNLDHGVLLVGYGTENGKDYWLIRNSWGSQWGDNGYIKILRTDKMGPGQCGIAMAASYPTLE